MFLRKAAPGQMPEPPGAKATLHRGLLFETRGWLLPWHDPPYDPALPFSAANT